MYKIEANGKYILLIKDLDKIVSYENKNGIIVSDEDFSRSNDIKKMMRYLKVAKIDSVDEMDKKSVILEETSKEDTFIAHNTMFTNPEDAFVSDPNKELNVPLVKEAEIEEVVKENKEQDKIQIDKESVINEENSEVVSKKEESKQVKSEQPRKRGRKPKNA